MGLNHARSGVLTRICFAFDQDAPRGALPVCDHRRVVVDAMEHADALGIPPPAGLEPGLHAMNPTKFFMHEI